MPENPAHFGFILASYLVTAAVLVGLVVWTFLDGRAQRRRLAVLESRGVRRRSAGAKRQEAGSSEAATGIMQEARRDAGPTGTNKEEARSGGAVTGTKS